MLLLTFSFCLYPDETSSFGENGRTYVNFSSNVQLTDSAARSCSCKMTQFSLSKVPLGMLAVYLAAKEKQQFANWPAEQVP